MMGTTCWERHDGRTLWKDLAERHDGNVIMDRRASEFLCHVMEMRASGTHCDLMERPEGNDMMEWHDRKT